MRAEVVRQVTRKLPVELQVLNISTQIADRYGTSKVCAKQAAHTFEAFQSCVAVSRSSHAGTCVSTERCFMLQCITCTRTKIPGIPCLLVSASQASSGKMPHMPSDSLPMVSLSASSTLGGSDIAALGATSCCKLALAA